MFQYVSAVGIVATIMTLLMVTAMLYLVWGALGNSAHTPSPDDGDQPELARATMRTRRRANLPPTATRPNPPDNPQARDSFYRARVSR